MEKFKRILLKLLFPHIVLIVILVPFSAALLIYAFAYENAHPVIVYASYFISAYALTIVCAKTPVLYRKIQRIKENNRYISLYTSEAGLRVKLSLYGSIIMNTLYALFQFFLGMFCHSVWFYALAGYYILLVVMRFFLLKEMRQNRWGENKFFEYLLYRLMGVFLVIMNVALSVVVFYIVWQNSGFEYHYIVTIAMAAYTFFSLTMAIVHIAKYRKYKSPVMSASKAINLVAALVSMLSLETAMLTAFGEDNGDAFRQIMTGCTGTAVCVMVLAIAIYMIVHSTKEINQIKGV